MQHKPYGYELIIDMQDCVAVGLKQHFFGITFVELLLRRLYLRGYFRSLCKAIRMKPQKRTYWDDMWCWPWNRQTKAHTTGTSAVQFIITSNITVHYLELADSAYVNIFSCKPFSRERAVDTTKCWFKPGSCKTKLIERG